ncbi:MAG: tRNA ((37)-N6)-threonylcarbamoyltransferase complex dimerization subunit type 1 TsaB, partial [Acidobacteria bacterium]|nr:tRNA ((37)-N6)-threonylcarbamoyltransferase complex dimerization subunit type 1 TsaB [Acidobacteriota bacterium]
ALAHAAAGGLPPGALIGAWMDAHRGDVFSALYRITAAAASALVELTEIEGPTVGRPEATLARWRALADHVPDLFAGDGAILYADEIARESTGARVLPSPLLAGVIGRLAIRRASSAVDPSAARPLYVRRPDVEVVRDEKLRLH